MCYLSRLVWLFSEVQKCLADISPKTEGQNLNVVKLMIYILYVKDFEDKIYFSLCRIPKTLDILTTIRLVWYFHDNAVSKITSKKVK